MKFNFTYLLIFLALASCHKTNSLVSPHELENTLSVDAKPAESLKVPALLSGPMTYETDIKPFEKSLLDANELLDPKTAHSDLTRDNLAHLNQAILQLNEKDIGVISKNRVLEKYEALLLHSCDSELKSCDSVEILKQDPMSVRIAMLIAKSKSDVADYYKMLLLAFSLKNLESQPQLLSLYVKRFPELISYVKIHPNSKLFVENQNLLSIVISDNVLKSSPEFSELLKVFSPWQYSMTKSQGASSDDLSIFLANAQNNMYEKSGSVSSILTSAIKKIQDQQNSFSDRQESLFTKKSRVVSNLQLKKLDTRNEYFYLIDRLFTGDIRISEADILWDASHQDYAQFSSILKNYVQVEFIEKVLLAHSKMSQIFSSSNPVMVADLYSQVILQSHSISIDLMDFSKRVLLLNQVSSYVLAKRGLIRDETSDYLNATAKNIYYYVVLPHMMMLAREMYVKGFNQTVDFGYGPYNIDGATVTQFLYHGIYTPWFDYSTIEKSKVNPDTIPTVKSQELMYAFDIAMNTEAFEYFGIDVSDYIFDLFTQLSAGLNRIVSNDILDIQTHFESDNDWQNVLRLCQGIESGAGFYHRVDAREPFNKSLQSGEVSEFEQGAFLGALIAKFQDLNGFQLHNANRTEGLDYVRILVEPNQHMLRLYIDLYTSYLAKLSADKSKVERLEGLYSQTNQLVQSQLTKFIKVNSDYNHCYFTLFNKEIEEQDKILLDRIQFLKSVYADMKTLRNDPKRKAELNKKYKFVDMGHNSLGTERFDENIFHSLIIDFAVNAKRFYQSSKDPIENLTEIYLPENLSQLMEYKRPKLNDISFTDSEDDFVASGLNSMISSRGSTSADRSFMHWFDSEFIMTRLFTYFSRDLVALNRMDATRNLVKVEDLYSLPMKIINLLILKPTDMEVLKAARKTSRFLPILLSDYYNPSEGQPISYFDYVFYMSSQDYLSKYMPDPFPEVGNVRMADKQTLNADPNLVPLAKEAMNFSDLKNQQIIPLFDLDLKSVDAGLAQYYRSELQSEMKLNENLRNYIVGIYRSDLASGHALKFSLEINKSYDVPYLSPGMSKAYDNFIFTLNQKTSGLFLN